MSKEYWNRKNIGQLAKHLFPQGQREQVVLVGVYDSEDAEDVSSMVYIHPRDIDGAINIANKLAPEGRFNPNLFVTVPISELPKSSIPDELITVQEDLDKQNKVNTVWRDTKETVDVPEETLEDKTSEDVEDDLLNEWEAGWYTDENIEKHLNSLPADDDDIVYQTVSKYNNVPSTAVEDDPLYFNEAG